MEGISKERLIDELEMSCEPFRRDVINELIEECKELNPWKPISDAPEGRPLRLFVNYSGSTEGYQTEGYISSLNRHLYTHYQELPDNPK